MNQKRFQSLLNHLTFKQLEITFRIPSHSKYEHGFITMIMLTEKMTNNQPIFLLDKHTLSKNKTIKIGLVLTVKNEMIDYYLKLCCTHSIPKFYSYGVFFNLSSKTNTFSYTLTKILSNTLFSFDKDINSYYDYLGELPFEFDFLFRTYFKNRSINQLLISSKGIHFINEIHSNVILQTKEIDEMISQEDESDVDEELYADLINNSDNSSDDYLSDELENEYDNELENGNYNESGDVSNEVLLEEKVKFKEEIIDDIIHDIFYKLNNEKANKKQKYEVNEIYINNYCKFLNEKVQNKNNKHSEYYPIYNLSLNDYTY